MKIKQKKRVPAADRKCKRKAAERKNKIAPLPVNGSSIILPLHSRYVTYERETKIWADFRIIFIVALLIGLPIPPSLWKTKRKRVDSCLAAWNHCAIFVRTVVVVIYLSNSKQFWTTMTMRITFDMQILAGYASIWIFSLHGGIIESSLKKLISMSPPLRSMEKGRSLSIKMALLLCALVIVLFNWTASKFLYIGAYDYIAARLNPGVPLLQEFHYYFTSIVIFSFIFSYHMGTATLYAQVLLCSQAYWSCGRLLRSYGEELQKQMKKTPLSVDTISRMLAEFKSVSSCIKNVDKTLGECPLMTYLFVMNDVFTVMGTLLSRDRKHGSIEYDVFLVARILSATVMFLYLTHNADAVAREKRALQKRMARVSQSIMRPSTSSHLAMVFYNLYSSIRSTDLCITCFDFFDIKREIILSGAGVFLTYGIWLYQFAATE